ncbi:MAG TPA: hypothetical protein PLE42_10310 [Candidatus Competibacteraceae bacterium]|nr:hypothetical protein [Candidatus Competibacteraceae bacterium]
MTSQFLPDYGRFLLRRGVQPGTRLGWIRPVLVNATHLTTPMPPKPKPYRVR